MATEFMSIDLYMKNPSGKYSANFASRKDIIANLDYRYNKLKQAISCDIHYRDQGLYDARKGTIYFVFKIPSETFGDKLLYDIVLELIPINGEHTKTTVSNYQMKVFSNNPSFVYTYAYSFNSRGLFITSLKKYINPIALKKEPKIRNPQDLLGYDKDIYFAISFIKENRLMFKSNILTYKHSIKYIKDFVIDNITDSDAKEKEYKDLMARRVKENKAERRLNKSRRKLNKESEVTKSFSKNRTVRFNSTRHKVNTSSNNHKKPKSTRSAVKKNTRIKPKKIKNK